MTARITALRPGASPPPVLMPIRFIGLRRLAQSRGDRLLAGLLLAVHEPLHLTVDASHRLAGGAGREGGNADGDERVRQQPPQAAVHPQRMRAPGQREPQIQRERQCQGQQPGAQAGEDPGAAQRAPAGKADADDPLFSLL